MQNIEVVCQFSNGSMSKLQIYINH